MATIKSSIVVQDMASSVFAKIHSNVSKTTAGFKNLNSEMSNAPTKAINNADRLNASAVKTELAYQAELQVLRQVESETKKIIAAEGTQSAKAQDLISSVVEQRKLVEGLKKDYENVSSITEERQRLGNLNVLRRFFLVADFGGDKPGDQAEITGRMSQQEAVVLGDRKRVFLECPRHQRPV